MKTIIENIAIWYCRNFHKNITRPVMGKYYCLECCRQHNSPWN
jgi:hypothetical protein